MADNIVKVGVEVSDNGTAGRTTKNVEKLKDVLNQTEATAVRASKSLNAMNVSRPAAASAQGLSMVGPTASSAYGVARGSVGTGAEGRDFAKQAQGLGGLVRIYATFAANIFAVGAAFEALKKAAAIDRLTEAADLLSVKTGVNLKSLAKELQSTTNYALSFQEALKFSNIGTAAGISSKQIVSLTKIAKGAATALGRDTADSIQRIIQGTAKQEQEILDELGIFVKAKTAYEKYAKEFNIKGGADALTAQQKVIAYANEVERVGAKYKAFAEIDDPFSRFIAKASEDLNALLKAINSVFVPLLGFLAESGNSIRNIILLVSGLLLKRAVPELKNFLTDLFTFDSAKVKATADDARLKIITSYAQTTKQLEALKAKRDALVISPVTKESVLSAVGPLAAVRGKDGQEGISTQRLSTALLGAKGDADLSKYKQVSDVQKTISGSLKAQLADSSKQSVLLDSLIAKGVLTKTSTAQKLALDAKGLELAQALFVVISNTNTGLAKRVLLDQKILDIANKQVTQGQQVELAGFGKRKGPKSGQAPGLDIVASGMSAAGGSREIQKSVGPVQAWNKALATSNDLQNSLAAGMGQGILNSFKTFGAVLGTSLTGITTAGKGLGFLSGMFATAGAAAASFGVVVSGAFKLIGAAFGPILILMTIWDLFGDKIKEFVGYTSDATRKRDADKVSVDAWINSVAMAGKALEDLKTRQDAASKAGDSDELLRVYSARTVAVNELIKATEDSIQTQKKEAAEYELKKAKSDPSKPFSEAGYFAEQLLKTTTLTVAQQDSLSRITKLVAENQQRVADKTMTIEEFNRRSFILQENMLPLLKSIGIEVANTESAFAGWVTGTQNATDALLKWIENSKKPQGDIFKVKEVEDSYNQLKKLYSQPITPSEAVSAVKAASDQLDSLTKNAKNVSPAIANLLSGLKAGAKGTTAEAAAAYKQLQEIAGSKEFTALFKGLQTQFGKTETKPKPYSTADLAALNALKNEADSAARAITLLNSELANTAGRNARNTAVQGYASMQGILAEKELKDLAATEQKTKAIAEAEKQYQEVLRKRTEPGEDRSQLLQEAKAARDRAIAEADIQLEQSKQNNTLTQGNDIISSKLALNQKIFETEQRAASIIFAEQDAQLEIDQAKLNSAKERGTLLQDEINDQQKLLDIKKADLTYTQGIAKLESERIKEIQDLAARVGQGGVNDEAISRRVTEINDKFLTGSALLDVNKTKTKQVIELNSNMDERTKAYAQAFQSTVMSMSDALVDFALTGKQSFGQMIESMIIGLIKLETQMMITKAFSAAGGFSGIIGSLFSATAGSFGSSTGAGTSILDAGSVSISPTLAAKGAAYDSGVQMFAKGGAFTNTVVTKPTMFAFAKGAGLMGESGPEAIMPLKRGANGSLGVEGTGTKVDVVVNNYGTEKATTKETTDSRGNRRIEVQIGEMVATEMQRPNSAVQGTMRNTFGVTPMLTRR